MEERLSKLEEEVKFLRDLNRDLIERVIVLHSNQNSLERTFEQIPERFYKLSETLVREGLKRFASSYESDMKSLLQRSFQALEQQEQVHQNEIKDQHKKWYDQYVESLRNNQLLWTGFLSLLLTIIILGMFTFLATITDSHTRSMIDMQMNHIESKIQNIVFQQKTQKAHP